MAPFSRVSRQEHKCVMEYQDSRNLGISELTFKLLDSFLFVTFTLYNACIECGIQLFNFKFLINCLYPINYSFPPLLCIIEKNIYQT